MRPKTPLFSKKFISKLIVVLVIPMAGFIQAAPTTGACAITSPTNGATITGPITVSGTFTKSYQMAISFNAGTIYDPSMSIATGTGTWSYTWDPSSPTKFSGNVEITARCFAESDRYFRWATPVNVTVNIPANTSPTISLLSPAEGSTASGTTPITVAASDVQGLSNVQVRVDWGTWQTATLSGGNYVYNWAAPATNKTHAIEAQAIDSNGNVTKTATKYIKTGTGTNQAPALLQADRAMWVWEPASYQLVENLGARNVLAQFMNDTNVSSHQRKTIYLYADRFDGAYAVIDNPAQYRSFISWAHSQGYYVHALVGSSTYLAPFYAYSRYHPKAVELIESVLNYNITSVPNEQFDGMNVDIEPHGLADWVSNSPAVQVQYLDMFNKMMLRKIAAGQNLNIGPAIPRSWDENSENKSITWNGKTQWLAFHVQDIADYVSVMDYRDIATGASGIESHAIGEISYGNQIGKKVMLAVETDQISASGDPQTISFQEEGNTYMETQLNAVSSFFSGDTSFLGLAIHHYDSYRTLPNVWSSNGTRWQSTVPDSANPSTPSGATVSVYNWQRLDLHWARSSDDVQVDYYEVHRSITSGFTPTSLTLARTTGNNFVKDWGLMANTTYYYKVIAVDFAGNKSAASAQFSATTPAGVGLVPLKIDSITMTAGSTASATIKVVNANTGVAISGVTVFGHWEGAAGKKFSNKTGSAGTVSTSSESLGSPYTAIFVPEILSAAGYYWAYSADVVHTGTLSYP